MLEDKTSIHSLNEDEVDLAAEFLKSRGVNGYQVSTVMDLIRDYNNVPGEDALIKIFHNDKFDLIEDYSRTIAARSLSTGLDNFSQRLIDNSLASLIRGDDTFNSEEKAILATGVFYFDDDPYIKEYTQIYLSAEVLSTVFEEIARGIKDSPHIERSSALTWLSEIDMKAAAQISEDILSVEKNDVIPDINNDGESLRRAAEKVTFAAAGQEQLQTLNCENVGTIMQKASLVTDVLERESTAQVKEALETLFKEHPRLATVLATTALNGDTGVYARSIVERYSPALLAAIEGEYANSSF